MNKLISVIIPVYNAENTIKKSIESVLDQTYKNIELIIINDCSNDGTTKILDAYKDNKKISLVNLDKNSGTASLPKNTGIKMAQGDFIAFLDSDDYWEKTKLEEQAKLFTDENVGLVYSDGKFFGKNNRKVGKLFSDYLNFERGNKFNKLITSNFIPSSSVIVRSNIIKKLNGFSEDKNLFVGEDFDLWLKIAQFSKIDFIAKPLFNYYISGDGLSGDKSKGYKCTLYLHRKWLSRSINFYQKALFAYAYIKIVLKLIIHKLKLN